MARYLRARNVISGLFGVIFVGFGGKIALDALRQLRG
jgi:threonine/homoserine/homoserine lactone efflux protein